MVQFSHPYMTTGKARHWGHLRPHLFLWVSNIWENWVPGLISQHSLSSPIPPYPKRQLIYSLKNDQIKSVAQSCPTLCDPMNRSTPGLPVHHQLPGFIQTHVHWVGDAIQPSHPLSSPSPPALSLSQHQGLFKGVSSLHQVAKVLEFQLQHQSF